MLAAHILCPQSSGMLCFARLPQSVPTAVPCATIMKSQITEKKLFFKWLVSFVIFLLPRSAVLVMQNVGQILKITSECNTGRMMKDLM